MQAVTTFLKYMAKPLMWFLNSVWDLWIRFDGWWGAKKTTEKNKLRKNTFIFFLIISIIYVKVDSGLVRVDDNNRNNNRANSLQKEVDECKTRETKRLMAEVEKYNKEKAELTDLKIELAVLKTKLGQK